MFFSGNKKKNTPLMSAYISLSYILDLVFHTSCSALGKPIKQNMNDIALPHCTHKAFSQTIWFYGLI